MRQVGLGLERAPELHGAFHIAPIYAKDAYAAPLVSDSPLGKTESMLGDLVDHYTQRTELTSNKRRLESQIRDLTTQLEARQAELRCDHAVMADGRWLMA